MTPNISMSQHPFPSLATDRLLLRPFSARDGATVERLAGAHEVADTTLNIPHPYPTGGGADWIMTHADAWEREQGFTLAICLRPEHDTPIGAISIQFSLLHAHGELGYWLGADHWGQGFATEASRAVMSFAFTTLALHRIQARHFTRNPASGRVMQKLGMQLEGIHRDAFKRWNVFEDVAVYAVLAPEWSLAASSPRGLSE
jgi:[ribosomal protein S5]-alanine N-acetyltransferase